MCNEARGSGDADKSINALLIVIALYAGSLLLLTAILMTNSLAAIPTNRPAIALVHDASAGPPH